MALLLELSGELGSPFLGLCKILLRGMEDDRECVEWDTHTRLELEQTALDVLDTLTRPAIRAKDTSIETTMDDGVDASDDVPDGWESLTDESGRADEDTLCLADSIHDLGERSVDDVVHFNVETVLLETGLNGFSKSLGELVGSCIGDNDERVARARDRSGPVAIEFDVVLHVLTKDRAVAAADGLEVDILELGKAIEHVLLEGAEDAIEVVLVGAEHVLLHLGVLGDLVVEHERVAVVSTKEVAGDDGLELRDVGDHGVGPVEERADDELESVATDVDGSRLVVDGHGLGELLVADELDVPEGRTSAHDRGIRIAGHQQGQSAAVVGLSVVQNDVVDLLLRLEHSLDALLELGKVGLLDGLEEDVGLLALEQEAVVGRAEGGGHDHVERAKLRVKSADPVEVLFHKKRLVLSRRHCFMLITWQNTRGAGFAYGER